jgi:hypothetical protein
MVVEEEMVLTDEEDQKNSAIKIESDSEDSDDDTKRIIETRSSRRFHSSDSSRETKGLVHSG